MSGNAISIYTSARGIRKSKIIERVCSPHLRIALVLRNYVYIDACHDNPPTVGLRVGTIS